ncbi:MAG: PASTA domain-containing protein [Niabella sp.]
MFKFITNRPLWVNILIGFILALGIFVATISSLGWFTNHNDAKTVPPVLGKTLTQAQDILDKAGFVVEIQDSIYIDSLKPFQVIRQVPDEYEVVKSNRTVYLTINRGVAPLVEVPNVIGYSLRNAEMVLINAHLKLGDTTFRPDFAKNSVLEQLYNGVPIQPGAKIRQGSSISLVIGNGLGGRFVSVPNLAGMTFLEAKTFLDSNGIMLASVIPDADVTDTASAFVYRQNPERFDEDGNLRTIRAGQVIDIWLSVLKPVASTKGTIDGKGDTPEKDSTP